MTRPASGAILERMMALHPKTIDLTLGRMWRCLEAVGNPHLSLPPVIHVAGTNGKGSVQAMIRAGIEGAGQTAHAYTSPHLAQFHERIRIAGSLITEEELVRTLEDVLTANDGGTITYFEITTVAAFLAFARHPADWTLLEVGLGGRLDATNVVADPALTIITPVDYDHQQYLGGTLTEIAGEKAGIIKRGVPVIVGPQQDEGLAVIEARAERLGAPILAHGQHWHAWEENGRLIFQDETGLLDLPLPNLVGAHQIANAGCALMALRQLGLPEDSFEAAVTGAKWPARMQRIELPGALGGPQIRTFLDVGHNAHAAAGIARHLKANRIPGAQRILCMGLLNYRDIDAVLAEFEGCFDTGVAIDLSHLTFGYSADAIAARMQKAGWKTSTAATVLGGLAAAREGHGDQPAQILIFGSFYLAEVLNREIPIPGLEAPA